SLYLASTATRKENLPLWLHRPIHQGRMTNALFWLSMPSQKRSNRPRVFYPYMVSCTEPRPLSWKCTTRRTVSLSLRRRRVPKPQSYDSRLTSHLSRVIRGGTRVIEKSF